MNHGGAPHTKFEGGKFKSVNFYNHQSSENVIKDINKGHAILNEVLSITPVGFRAPHFGSFENFSDLRLIYQTINSLNYKYASTTTPLNIIKFYRDDTKLKIREYPVTGDFFSPFKILDSWEHCENQFINPRITETYFHAIKNTVSKLVINGLVGHINIYCDPSHVVGSRYFNEIFEVMQKFEIPHMSFDELIGKY